MIYLAYSIMVIFLGCAMFFDLKHKIIPDKISILGIIAGIVFSLFTRSLGFSILGILAGGGFIYAVMIGGEFMIKGDFMGGGDVKISAMIGSFVGWETVIIASCIAMLFAISFVLIKKTTIAYVPFLGFGMIVCLIYGF